MQASHQLPGVPCKLSKNWTLPVCHDMKKKVENPQSSLKNNSGEAKCLLPIVRHFNGSSQKVLPYCSFGGFPSCCDPASSFSQRRTLFQTYLTQVKRSFWFLYFVFNWQRFRFNMPGANLSNCWDCDINRRKSFFIWIELLTQCFLRVITAHWNICWNKTSRKPHY